MQRQVINGAPVRPQFKRDPKNYTVILEKLLAHIDSLTATRLETQPRHHIMKYCAGVYRLWSGRLRPQERIYLATDLMTRLVVIPPENWNIFTFVLYSLAMVHDLAEYNRHIHEGVPILLRLRALIQDVLSRYLAGGVSNDVLVHDIMPRCRELYDHFLQTYRSTRTLGRQGRQEAAALSLLDTRASNSMAQSSLAQSSVAQGSVAQGYNAMILDQAQAHDPSHMPFAGAPDPNGQGLTYSESPIQGPGAYRPHVYSASEFDSLLFSPPQQSLGCTGEFNMYHPYDERVHGMFHDPDYYQG